MLLKSPDVRFAVHVLLMFLGVFFATWGAAGYALDKSLVVAALAAAGRAALGLLTSTNPQVGKNVV